MGTGLQCGVVGLTDPAGGPATAAVSPNTRVKTASGFVATIADIVQFPGTPSVVGNWVVPATRCQANHLAVIHLGSVGIAYMPSVSGLTPTGPMQITAPDPRASAT